MKLHILSDLHTEFDSFEIPDLPSSVVVVAGDIGIKLQGFKSILAQRRAQKIICVAGNHEYYGASIPYWTTKFRRFTSKTNVDFLENDEVIIDGVRFLGCTLWTDFELFGDELRQSAMDTARAMMTDYRRIRLSPRFRRLRPFDTSVFHRTSLGWLKRRLGVSFDGPTVVVTHHAPSPRSLPRGYRKNIISPAYASALDHLLDGDRISLWIHGHTHFCVDYEQSGTRVISNQRGYPDEPAPGFQDDLIVEL